MGLLDALIGAPASYPVAGVAEALRREYAHAPLTEPMFDILKDGEASLHECSNIAAGHGRDVWVLLTRGLMQPAAFNGRSTTYRLTEAGRQALLAHLGVHEIAR